MVDNSTPRRPSGGDIHRLLDEAFAGIEMTPDAQDLKEEVRANLLARVADLEADGRSSTDAARQAIEELGDVRELVGESSAAAAPSPGGAAGWSAQNAAYRLARVRPKPAFVVRLVLASVIAACALVLAAAGALGALALPIGVTILFLGIGAAGVAWIVGDSLVQETTANHPMPTVRGAGYALATFLALYGLGFAALVVLGDLPVWALAFAAVGVLAGAVLYSFLGATQTNRHKAWLRQAQWESTVGNRFEQEPETAARFGIYTVIIWTVTAALYFVLSLTIGWSWSWLVFLGGFAVFMFVLARMLFGTRKD